HTRSKRDWSSDVCSSDLGRLAGLQHVLLPGRQLNPALGLGLQLLGGRRRRQANGVLAHAEAVPQLAQSHGRGLAEVALLRHIIQDRKSTRLNSSHVSISY